MVPAERRVVRRRLALLVVGALVASLLGTVPTASAEPPAEPGPTVFVGQLTTKELKRLADLGLDHEDLVSRGMAKDKVAVEVVLTRLQAAKLNALGLNLARSRSTARPCRSG